MPLMDDLTRNLSQPMWSASTPARTEVREDSGEKPLDQLQAVPPDGDTKSADPESWMTAKDINRHDVKKKLLMSLGGLGMTVFVADEQEFDGKPILNFVDHDQVPSGEIWINSRLEESPGIRESLLRAIIYCFLVWRDEYDRDAAKRIADSIDGALKRVDTEKE